MTLQLLFSCNRTLPSGMACRGALPTRTVIPHTAGIVAKEAGWTIGQYGDTCPSCTIRLKEPS